ncbi:MAG: dTMP kinase [Candidatus Eremiobacteraeota bacterium]|nr:dTMP kinase [Candidatus Eremiobacteraeota bacterium]
MLSALTVRLQERGVRVIATREPGGTLLGDRLREIFIEPGLRIDPIAEALLVNAARAQHVREVIEPALAAGTWILSDRFSAATLAYQGYGRGIDLPTLQALAIVATAGRRPDLTLLLDVPLTVSRERVAARARSAADEDRLEREDDAFHTRVRNGYVALAAGDPSFATLDGTLTATELSNVAWQAIEARSFA